MKIEEIRHYRPGVTIWRKRRITGPLFVTGTLIGVQKHLNKREYLVILRGIFLLILHKNICCDP